MTKILGNYRCINLCRDGNLNIFRCQLRLGQMHVHWMLPVKFILHLPILESNCHCLATPGTSLECKASLTGGLRILNQNQASALVVVPPTSNQQDFNWILNR